MVVYYQMLRGKATRQFDSQRFRKEDRIGGWRLGLEFSPGDCSAWQWPGYIGSSQSQAFRRACGGFAGGPGATNQ